jgi:hypothetical protein
MSIASNTYSNIPWSEVIRACAAGEIHQCAFGMRIILKRDRHEPRNLGLEINSGRRTIDIDPVYVCTCGAFVLGTRDQVIIDDIASITGAANFVDRLVPRMREVREELKESPPNPMHAIAIEIHADLVRQVLIHATRWNLPPFQLLGRTRARPAKCVHRKA